MLCIAWNRKRKLLDEKKGDCWILCIFNNICRMLRVGQSKECFNRWITWRTPDDSLANWIILKDIFFFCLDPLPMIIITIKLIIPIHCYSRNMCNSSPSSALDGHCILPFQRHHYILRTNLSKSDQDILVHETQNYIIWSG